MAAYLIWSDKLSVNVKEIDEEHKKLVNMLNELHTAIVDHSADTKNNIAKTVVLEMVAYASYHFATEEKYMLKYKYPGYAEHKKEHTDFLAEALALKGKVEQGGFVFTLGIANFLRQWLSNHIMGTDKKYSKFFNDHGLN